MRKLKYSPVYKEKLNNLRIYLDAQFGVKVRKKVLAELDKRVKMLKNYAGMGISVHDVYGIDCDYFCIYAAKNYVFYRVSEDYIYIVNFYNEREDFMQKMFGKKSERED
ncbi:MAG: type II toxin-antitoxin system RelE/ParE family toxin [bacterium]|nr:type II toxin-antitoxin system RelE/ParE family toxin [bacterium]